MNWLGLERRGHIYIGGLETQIYGGEKLPRPYGAVFQAVKPIKEDTQSILGRLDEIATRLDDITQRLDRLEKALNVRK